MLIDFIGDDIDIVPYRKIGNNLQLLPGKHFSTGVGGVAQNHGFDPVLPESVLQDIGIKPERRWDQRNIDRFRIAQNGVGTVVFVKG